MKRLALVLIAASACSWATPRRSASTSVQPRPRLVRGARSGLHRRDRHRPRVHPRQLERRLARIRAEAANPIFDVWFGGTGDPHLIAFREGLTEFYEPTVWGDIIQDLKDQVGGTYIPLYAGALGFVVNEGVLEGKPMPQGWRDLTDPMYKGLIAMPDPNSSGTAYTIIATLVQIFGEEEAFEILAGMHQNMRSTPARAAPPASSPAAVRSPSRCSSCTTASSSPPRASRSPPTRPSRAPATRSAASASIANAPNRDAAIAFIEWALTPEAQMLAASQGDSYQIQSNRTPRCRTGARPLDRST
jgi:iron(III) transport system substrate-binding protein